LRLKRRAANVSQNEEAPLPKFTIVDNRASQLPAALDKPDEQADPVEVLTLLKDYLNIGDPSVQQAVADLVAALSRVSGA
jgi:hypothetical protein